MEGRRLLITKTILLVFGGMLLISFIFPLISNDINAGTITGVIISTILIFVGVYLNPFIILINTIYKAPPLRAILILISGIIAILFFLVIIITIFMISHANRPPKGATTLVVLGCKIREDKPSRMLKSRLDVAYNYLAENPEAVCIVTGGQGENEDYPEAHIMFNYLVSKGISEDRIYIEDKSTSTAENLSYSKEIILRYNLSKDITIVTNEFHQFRSGIIAKKLGLKSYSISSRTRVHLITTYYVRELLAVAEQIAFH